MFKQYTIQIFIDNRLKELGFRRSELIKRCGYLNISKGARRLEKLYSGDLSSLSSRNLLSQLPMAIEVREEDLLKAIELTKAELDVEASRRDEIWRAAFKPDAFLLGTSRRPSQIFAFGLSGGVDRWLRIPLKVDMGPETFIEQALNHIEKVPVIQFFGPTTGFVINYTPDCTEQYDLRGALVALRDKYYYPGTVHLNFG